MEFYGISVYVSTKNALRSENSFSRALGKRDIVGFLRSFPRKDSGDAMGIARRVGKRLAVAAVGG